MAPRSAARLGQLFQRRRFSRCRRRTHHRRARAISLPHAGRHTARCGPVRRRDAYHARRRGLRILCAAVPRERAADSHRPTRQRLCGPMVWATTGLPSRTTCRLMARASAPMSARTRLPAKFLLRHNMPLVSQTLFSLPGGGGGGYGGGSAPALRAPGRSNSMTFSPMRWEIPCRRSFRASPPFPRDRCGTAPISAPRSPPTTA